MNSLINKYKELGIEKTIDHDKFNLISVVHHSTVLEGSTLTEIESSVLINDGLTPKGKPLEHSLMVTDHYKALIYVIEQANKKTPILEFQGQVFIKNICGTTLLAALSKSSRLTGMPTHSTPYNASTRQKLLGNPVHSALGGPLANPLTAPFQLPGLSVGARLV